LGRGFEGVFLASNKDKIRLVITLQLLVAFFAHTALPWTHEACESFSQHSLTRSGPWQKGRDRLG